MRTGLIVVAAAAGVIAVVAGANGQNALPEGSGWTGATHPAEIIAARKALMAEIDSFMPGIDYFAAGDAGNVADLKTAAGHIAKLLLALPHLFPPTTNLYDQEGNAEYRSTVALPAIWEDFEAFYAEAATTSEIALRASEAASDAEFRAAGAELRAACDACHATFMQAYVFTPPAAAPADLAFPFLNP